MALIAISLPLIVLINHQGLDARGRQFKGILPPKQTEVRLPKPEVHPLEVEVEPEYPQLNMIVNIPARKVMLYDEGREVARHDIAVGQPRYKTPTGPMEIKTIIWNPWWIPPNSPWARGERKQPPGPRNCLGPVKMLMEQGIRLHGTNKDSSVGRAVSHGCLRMHNEEASDLAWYIQMRINNPDDSLIERYKRHRRRSFYVNLLAPVMVDIIYKPVEVRDDIVYIYKDIYGWSRDVKTEVLEALLRGGIDLKEIDAEQIAKLSYPRGKDYVREVMLRDLLRSRKRGEDSCLATLEETE